jgi:exonuclease III
MLRLVLIISAFWNIRCMNKSGRLKCIVDFISLNKLDFICLQETKKKVIPNSLLDYVNKGFIWNYVPAKGSVGAILAGLKNSTLEFISWQHFAGGWRDGMVLL